MSTYSTNVIEFEGQPCVLLSDEICKEMDIQEGDLIDVSLDETKTKIVVKLLEK